MARKNSLSRRKKQHAHDIKREQERKLELAKARAKRLASQKQRAQQPEGPEGAAPMAVEAASSDAAEVGAGAGGGGVKAELAERTDALRLALQAAGKTSRRGKWRRDLADEASTAAVRAFRRRRMWRQRRARAGSASGTGTRSRGRGRGQRCSAALTTNRVVASGVTATHPSRTWRRRVRVGRRWRLGDGGEGGGGADRGGTSPREASGERAL